MRVAMWTSQGERCGIATYSRELAAALQRRGVGVEMVPVPYEDRSAATRADTLARLRTADLIHLQHEYSFFGGVAPGSSSLGDWYRALDVPRIVTAHSVFTAAEVLRLAQETRWRQRLAKRALAALPAYRAGIERLPFAGAAAVITHTDAGATRVRSAVPGAHVHVLPAGIPAPAPIPTAAALASFRERYGLTGARVLTIFGYITPDKGYDTALEALAGLPPGVKLLVAGGTRVDPESAFRAALEQDVRARALGDRVAITGYLSDDEVALAMAATDVVLVPHHLANGSYSVMVALSHGKPVLASDLACFREIADAGGGVELFAPGYSVGLAERAGFLLASAGARQQLAAAARAFAAGRGWDVVAEQTHALYLSALGGEAR